MKVLVPDGALVLLIGPSGSGKSSFAKDHFIGSETVSSDRCRYWVGDDENDQSFSTAAFEVVSLLVQKRLEAGKLTVVDATNLIPEHRLPLLKQARALGRETVAFVFQLPEEQLLERRRLRKDRDISSSELKKQLKQFRHGFPSLDREGFDHRYNLTSVHDIERLVVQKAVPYELSKDDTGPFDIIGDIHGCFDELVLLLEKLGYQVSGGETKPIAGHPQGRRAVFLGDLADRGPKIPAVFRLVMNMVAHGRAYMVPGNHDVKLVRKLKGRNVKVHYGLEQSLDQLEAEPDQLKADILAFAEHFVYYYQFDGGKLIVAHAGLAESLHGLYSGRAKLFALYGDTTGEVDEHGLPVRKNWAASYKGRPLVVYGHTARLEPEWLNNTLCLDTGCVYGGKLTAFRYPERECVSVPAKEVYYDAVRPLN